MLQIAHIPSSLKNFRACPRKWRFNIDAPHEDKEEFRYGTEIHKQRELYFTEGTPVTGAAAAGIEHLPPAGSAKTGRVLVEHIWSIPVGPVLLFGTSDLIDLRNPEMPAIIDHKTTTDIEKWALTPAELAIDPQLNCYAYYTLTRLAPKAERIALEHHYVEKPKNGCKPRGEPRYAYVTRDSVMSHWASIVENINQMAAYLFFEPNEVIANTEACGDYGGCRFLSSCAMVNS